jgi:chromosome segregation ATPase
METAQVNAEAFGAEAGVTPVVNTPDVDASAVNTQSSKFYTEDDLAKVRSQEKEKLYPQIEKLKEEVDVLKRSREEEAARIAAAESERKAQIASEQKQKDESELEVRDLLAKKEQEWSTKLETERQEREKAFALLEREREFQELSTYRQQRLEQERENIIPELVDLISGNSRDEIEQSIAGLKERSAKIFDSVAQVAQQSRKEMVGTRITSPASGPLDNDSDSRTYSADDLSKMSMADYAKNRSKLLSNSNNRGQGLFG